MDSHPHTERKMPRRGKRSLERLKTHLNSDPRPPKGSHSKTSASPSLSSFHKPIFARAESPPVRSSFKADNQDFNFFFLITAPKIYIVAASQ